MSQTEELGTVFVNVVKGLSVLPQAQCQSLHSIEKQKSGNTGSEAVKFI